LIDGVCFGLDVDSGFGEGVACVEDIWGDVDFDDIGN
jgi:hypothetical protein